MGFEQKDQNADNTGYPATAYNVVTETEVTKFGGAVGTGHGEEREYKGEWIIDLTDLPTTSVDNQMISTFPEGAVPKTVDIRVLKEISGGTSLSVGLSQPDGTVIDASGLVSGYIGTAVGDYAVGSGALIDTVVATESQLTVGGTRTAGVFRVSVSYLIP